RSDIYSIGLVLYEMFAGALPHQAETFAKLVVQITTRAPQPLPPKTHGDELLPRALADVVMKCLEKNPDDRFASAEELAVALEPFTGHPQPEVFASKTDIEAIAKLKPRPARALFAMVLLVGVVSAGGYWAWGSSEPAPPVAATPPPPAVQPVTLDVQ